jgi:hypothetical protein
MPKTKKIEEVKLDAEHTTLVDNAFTVDKARWGTFRSFDSEGKALVTSPTEEACVEATRFYLKARQGGFTEIATSYTGHVDGKL